MVKLQNATQQVGSKKTPKDKIAYKNQKRQTRNRLIYLVCLHLLYIFIFVGLLCLQYLIPRDWRSAFFISAISDALFAAYALQTLVAIKFKNRKLLITSITTLALTIGTKIGTLILLINNQRSPFAYLIVAHTAFLAANIAVPWCLLLLWNKLKQSKWRETFDLHTKLTSHLSSEDLASQETIQKV